MDGDIRRAAVNAGQEWAVGAAERALPYLIPARTDDTIIAIMDCLERAVRDRMVDLWTGHHGGEWAELWAEAARRTLRERLIAFDAIAASGRKHR